MKVSQANAKRQNLNLFHLTGLMLLSVCLLVIIADLANVKITGRPQYEIDLSAHVLNPCLYRHPV